MIVDKDSKPEETIYYTACCLLELLKRKRYNHIDELQVDLSKEFGIKPNYSSFSMSLNFLFLIERIKITPKEIICI